MSSEAQKTIIVSALIEMSPLCDSDDIIDVAQGIRRATSKNQLDSYSIISTLDNFTNSYYYPQ